MCEGEVKGKVFGCEDEVIKVGSCCVDGREVYYGFCRFDEGNDFDRVGGVFVMMIWRDMLKDICDEGEVCRGIDFWDDNGVDEW